MYRIDPPITGEWPFDGYPDAVEIEEYTFNRAVRKQPYDGVVEQYRESKPKDSMHLMILEDNSFIIDHVDEYNPDMGHPVLHFLKDHPKGAATAVVGAGALGIMASAVHGAKKANDAKRGAKEASETDNQGKPSAK